MCVAVWRMRPPSRTFSHCCQKAGILELQGDCMTPGPQKNPSFHHEHTQQKVAPKRPKWQKVGQMWSTWQKKSKKMTEAANSSRKWPNRSASSFIRTPLAWGGGSLTPASGHREPPQNPVLGVATFVEDWTGCLNAFSQLASWTPRVL